MCSWYKQMDEVSELFERWHEKAHPITSLEKWTILEGDYVRSIVRQRYVVWKAAFEAQNNEQPRRSAPMPM